MTRCRHRVQRDRVETLRVLVGSPILNHTKWNLPLPQQTRSITIPNLLRTSRDHSPLMTSMDNFIKQNFSTPITLVKHTSFVPDRKFSTLVTMRFVHTSQAKLHFRLLPPLGIYIIYWSQPKSRKRLSPPLAYSLTLYRGPVA